MTPMFERPHRLKNRASAARPAETGQDRRRSRAGGGALRLLRWLRNLFKRPFHLRWQGAVPRIAYVERRGAPSTDHPRALAGLRAQLDRLLAEGRRSGASEVLLPLRVVHNELARRGWSGVELLPSRVLAKARLQAELVGGGASSLAPLVERLHLLEAAAQVREERKARLQAPALVEQIEVSEATVEEFDEMEKSWLGVMPPIDATADASRH